MGTNLSKALGNLSKALVCSGMIITQNVIADCIGVVTAGGGVSFWAEVAEGATQAGQDLNRKVIVRGTKYELDVVNQKLILENMVSAGCVGFVVAPNSPDRIEQVQDLSKSGSPVVLMDRDMGAQGFTVVKTDNFKAGQQAGEAMINTLPQNSNIAIFRLAKAVQSTTQREEGFISKVKSANFNVVADAFLGSDATEASIKAFNILKANPEIDGIFTPNESTTLAVLNVRKRLALKGNHFSHIGFDLHPSFVQAIRDDDIQAVIVQKPFQMGYQAVETLVNLLEGRDAPQQIETPVLLVDKLSIDYLN